MTGLHTSFLPESMQSEIHGEIGLDPWDENVSNSMTTALGAAAKSDGTSALLALLKAETTYRAMTPDQVLAAVMQCGKEYRFLIDVD